MPPGPSPPTQWPVTPAQVRQQLERILHCAEFQSADRLSRLLQYLVEDALAHPGEPVNEYSLGLDVFDRKEDFDPKISSVVRVQTGRLRQKLARYYEQTGANDPVHIEIPAGCYMAVISASAPAAVSTPVPAAPASGEARKLWRLAAMGAALVILVGAALLLSRRLSRQPDPIVTPFTADSGAEDDAGFSPDGEWVAYSGAAGRSREIFVKSVRDGRVRRLTHDDAVNFHPAWSPDGSAVAFARTQAGGVTIWLIPANGGPERKIGETRSTINESPYAGSPAFPVGPAWTRDGRSVVVSDKRGVTGPDSLFLLDISTGARKQLTSPAPNDVGDCEPAVSPDARSVAFARFTTFSTGDIFTVSIDGGRTRRITEDHAVVRGVDWTPDGKQLIFSSNRGGTQRLWRASAGGGSVEPFDAPGLNAINPVVSRTSRRLVYTESHANTNIWRASLADPATTAAPLIASTRRQDSARYSPDGSRIAFDSDRSGNLEIWTCDANGQDPRRLTKFDGPVVGSPRWSPNGQWIAFDARADGRSNVHLVSADGRSTRRIEDASAERMMPTWTSDGHSLYIAARRNGMLDLWRIPWQSGDARQLTHSRGYDAIEIPGSDLLVFTKQHTPGFWTMRTDGSEERPIAELAGIEAHRYWAVRGQSLYFLSGAGPPYKVGVFDFTTREIRQVAEIHRDIIAGTPSLDISPDGQYLVYSQVDNISSDLMLVDQW